jgi:moderate conductance mechanosensitive channel
MNWSELWIKIEGGVTIWAPVVLRVLLIMVILAVVWGFLQALVKRFMTRSSVKDGTGSKRLTTLAVISRSVINVALLALGVTWVLSELGINLGPILAAAGVLGLAVGFGAQSLVADVLNGFFMILEGQVRVGDWILTKEGSRGRVDEITMRTLILRDIEGNVHIIPHSKVDAIVNMTMAFSICQIDMGIAYREDADDVIRILAEEAENLRNDKKVGKYILGPADILGISEFADSAIIYRLRLRTETGRQWAVRRMYNLYIKRRLDKEGIEIPFPHVTVYMGEDKEGNSPPLNVTGKMEQDLSAD